MKNKIKTIEILLIGALLGLSAVQGCGELGKESSELSALAEADTASEVAVGSAEETETVAETEAGLESETVAEAEAETGSTTESEAKQSETKKSETKKKDSEKKESKKKESKKQEEESKDGSKKDRVKPQWLYYGSCSGMGINKEQKKKLDSLVKKWTGGDLSDCRLEEKLAEYLAEEQGININGAGVVSRRKCLFPGLKDIPDYGAQLSQRNGLYNFMGLYTDGKVDSEGNLICYYWEAGVM